MRAKQFFMWLLASALLFTVVNGVSYFVRSDGHGLVAVSDGVMRFGWPFVMYEAGGFAFQAKLILSAALGDVIAALALTAGVFAMRHLIKRTPSN